MAIICKNIAKSTQSHRQFIFSYENNKSRRQHLAFTLNLFKHPIKAVT